MWVRKRIDIGWRGLAGAVMDCARGGDVAPFEERIAALWGRAGRHPFVNLSVRSGFDSLLTTLAFEPGDEIAMSALTIPDMPNIVREHGLLPVPIDVEPESMNVRPEQVEAAISPRTRAVVVAHLFGGRVPLEPIAEVCRRRGVLLIEDCAQAFTGWDFTGSPQADVSMFSFGPIKTHTSLIGSVFTIKDRDLKDRMAREQETWPTQSSAAYFKRAFKYGFVKGLSIGWIAGSVATMLRWMGRDHDRLATNMARGFAGGDFFAKIRQRPSAPILRTLARRFERFNPAAVERRRALGKRFVERVGEQALVLSAAAEEPTFWVLPVMVDNPRELVTAMWRRGFDATCSSSLQVIPAPADRPHLDAAVGRATLDATVFLPFYHHMPQRVVDAMADLVRQTARPLAKPETRRVLEGPTRYATSLSLSRSST